MGNDVFFAKSRNVRKAILGFGAVVCVILAWAMSPIAAHADSISGNIDAHQRGSLTVHKFAQPSVDTDLAHDGTELDESALADLTPIADVTFSITRIPDVDITTQAGWDTITSRFGGEDAVSNALHDIGGVAALSATTDASGVASFSKLDLGVYLIQETTTPQNVTKSQPFVVTIPLQDSAKDGSWIYDVHVYPKNVVSSITKDVKQGVSVDDPIVWTITSSIPGDKASDLYRIVDTLDSRLKLVSTSVTITGTSGEKLSSPQDYTVTSSSESSDGHSSAGNTVTIEFSESGRNKLFAAIAADSRSTVRTVLTTKATSLGSDGIIPNSATLFPNASTTIVSNKPQAVFGNITIKKVSKDDGKALAGASFQVFSSREDATASRNPISINALSSWESDSQGRVTVNGLAYGTYWLREVKAPNGYIAIHNPIAIRVTSYDSIVDYTVENSPETKEIVPGIYSWHSGSLARTGASIASFAIVLVASGAIGAVLLRRKVASSANLGGEER